MVAFLRKYADFTGRAGRVEFAILFGAWMVLTAVAGFADGLDGHRAVVAARMGMIELSVFIILLLPAVSAGVRRLHDTNRSGFWLLLLYIPYLGWLATPGNPQGETFAVGGVLVGTIALTVFLFLPSDPEENRFGLPPKGM